MSRGPRFLLQRLFENTLELMSGELKRRRRLSSVVAAAYEFIHKEGLCHLRWTAVKPVIGGFRGRWSSVVEIGSTRLHPTEVRLIAWPGGFGYLT